MKMLDTKAKEHLKNVAINAIQNRIAGQNYEKTSIFIPGESYNGVFVTLKKKSTGALRGCIGFVNPIQSSLEEAVAQMATSSALDDPRFLPVVQSELDDLDVEISILNKPEKISDTNELDPNKYGIIVRSGTQMGLLLPNIDGVTTAQQQIAIAKDKAQIRPGQDIQLERFSIQKIT